MIRAALKRHGGKVDAVAKALGISRKGLYLKVEAAEAAYAAVIFVLFPLAIWTGLALSPAFVSAVPAAVTLLGGTQSARTIHFFVSIALLLFFAIHVAMVWRAGFVNRVGAMITGRAAATKE